MDLDKNIARLEKRLEGMKKYLMLKFEEEDWHGVADAAMDIRELIAELEAYKAFKSSNS